jgi:hypothetical protein
MEGIQDVQCNSYAALVLKQFHVTECSRVHLMPAHTLSAVIYSYILDVFMCIVGDLVADGHWMREREC